MKKQIFAVLLLILVFLLWLQPIDFGWTKVAIPEGANAKDIAEYLSHNHVVRDVNEFLFWLKISGNEKNLKSGKYELQKFKNPLYVINELARGGVSDISITIPEGLTIHETADILDINGVINREEFLALCTNRSFVEGLGLKTSSLEGYLFPDTYSFNVSQTDTQVILTFINNFNKRMEKFKLNDRDSVFKILTVASMVEKEAKFKDERSVIARVFLNRLKTNRPLESCATVLYVLKKTDYEKYCAKAKLTERDLKIDSPYNTYLHLGLPPGPICSPGESSIKAVISPAAVDYLYFVSMGNGRHHFSRTFREHVAAKEKYNVKK